MLNINGNFEKKSLLIVHCLGWCQYNDPCRLLLSFEILPNCLELECQDSHVKIPQAKVQCAAMVRFLRISEPNQRHRLCLMKKDMWPRRSLIQNPRKLNCLNDLNDCSPQYCEFADCFPTCPSSKKKIESKSDAHPKLVGGFKYVLFSPRSLGKISNLTSIFFRWVASTTN